MVTDEGTENAVVAEFTGITINEVIKYTYAIRYIGKYINNSTVHCLQFLVGDGLFNFVEICNNAVVEHCSSSECEFIQVGAEEEEEPPIVTAEGKRSVPVLHLQSR